MDKSTSGAIWLNAARLLPYDFWQFWRNTEDANVGRFLRLFTELPLHEIARLQALHGSELNEAKKVLADEVTALCHGREAAEGARETARRAFEEGEAAGALPTIEVDATQLRKGVRLADLMVGTGLAPSKSHARRLIRSGGARVNDKPVTDETARLTDEDARNGVIKLSAGRKRHALIRLVMRRRGTGQCQ
jgi:tyrosyl-tRNA synthetase